MDCTDTRTLLIARRRNVLPTDERASVDAHLEGCAACRHEDAADRELSLALERLPRRRAPESLKKALNERFGAPPRVPVFRRIARTFVPMAAGAAIAAAVMLVWRPHAPPDDRMNTEAINDYLRLLYSDHPLEIASGGPHQVKPWFEGRVDFAPAVRFGGDDDFPLQGGSVALFLDRKAATYVYKRRLHLITLFVFRAEGLPWPTSGLEQVGGAKALVTTSHGFHNFMWRDGDLGYALVSDVDPRDLRILAMRLAPPP